MTAIEIARSANARMNGGRWIACCPAHDDRSPSLSIREGRDGRVLLKCFAGCSTGAIAEALGLKLRDLFATDTSSRHRDFRLVTANDVESSLQAELERIITEESARTGFDSLPVLARHRNEARSIVERRYSVSLKREPTPWWEIEPHCDDPAWAACIDQAISEAAACRGVALETLRASISDLPRTQERVIAYARQLQRTLTKEPAGQPAV